MGKRMSVRVGAAEETRWLPVVASAELVAAAIRAMDTLLPAEREALMLWNGGMDYREIAQRTCQSSEAVGVHLTRARNRLVMAYDLLEAS